MEVELFEERRWENAGVGMALIRDGNGTRSFETLLRYRGAAMAEFWRALKTLKALQAEQAARSMPAAAAGVPELAEWQRPRPWARAAPARSAPRRTPVAADQTNPRASWHTCCPNRPWPAPPCTSPACAPRPIPNEPEHRSHSADIMTAQPGPGGILHEPAASAPNEPDRRPAAPAHPLTADV